MKTWTATTWTLALALACAAPPQAPSPEPSERAGRWRRAPSADATRLAEELEAIGYVQGSRAAGRVSGAEVRRADAMQPGLNLMVSGHRPWAGLVDASGHVRHSWTAAYSGLPGVSGSVPTAGTFWRRVLLLPGGDLLAIHEGLGILRVRRGGGVVWYVPNGAHHDLASSPDGTVWVLTRTARLLPRVHPSLPVLEDFVVQLDPATGQELRRISLVEALEAGGHPVSLATDAEHAHDLLHTNAVSVLTGEAPDGLPAFAPGHLLVSMLATNRLAVLDPSAGTVSWLRGGPFERQHEPSWLPGGRLLVFDNLGADGGSAVRELDARTMAEVWSWRGDPPLFTATCGTAHRLANGNTLITESDAGRAVEVTAEGEVVWVFRSRWRAGKKGRLVATLFDVERIGMEQLGWLQ